MIAIFQKLFKAAKEGLKFSQAKYSNFKVAAALYAKNGKIYTGCNVESSSYGLTICAERVALVKALSEGQENFDSILILSEKMDFCPPCGACRQLLNDYAPHLNIILTDGKNYKTYKINELLPMAFDDSQLPK